MEIVHEIKEVFQHQMLNIFSVFFSEDLDFTTKLLSFLCLFALALEMLYIVLPRWFQKKVESLDTNHATITGS